MAVLRFLRHGEQLQANADAIPDTSG